MVSVPRFSDCPMASAYGPAAEIADTKVGVVADAGKVTVFASSVTAVCASRRPLIEAPESRLMEVWANMIPSKWVVVFSATSPNACQKMFAAAAPPASLMCVPLAWVIFPAIWNIQTSLGLPLIVTSEEIKTSVLHL